MTTNLADSKTEPTARKGSNRQIVYLRDVPVRKPAEIRSCRIECLGHCACASKKIK